LRDWVYVCTYVCTYEYARTHTHTFRPLTLSTKIRAIHFGASKTLRVFEPPQTLYVNFASWVRLCVRILRVDCACGRAFECRLCVSCMSTLRVGRACGVAKYCAIRNLCSPAERPGFAGSHWHRSSTWREGRATLRIHATCIRKDMPVCIHSLPPPAPLTYWRFNLLCKSSTHIGSCSTLSPCKHCALTLLSCTLFEPTLHTIIAPTLSFIQLRR